MVSNTCWTLLQGDLQARRSELVNGLTLIARDPTFTKDEFNATLLRKWIDTYVLSPLDKEGQITENFARDLVKVFITATRKVAQANLEGSMRFIKNLRVPAQAHVFDRVFGGHKYLMWLLEERALLYFRVVRGHLVDLKRVLVDAEPPTEASMNEVLMGRGPDEPALRKQPGASNKPFDKATVGAFWKAYQMATSRKDPKTTLSGGVVRDVPAPVKRSKFAAWAERDRLMSVVLPQLLALYSSAAKWALLPADRMKVEHAKFTFCRVKDLSLLWQKTEDGVVWDPSRLQTLRRGAAAKSALAQLNPELFESLITKAGQDPVLEVLDFSYVLKDKPSPLNPDAVKLPVMELEALILRHYGVRLGLPQLSATTEGRKERALMAAALSAWASGKFDEVKPLYPHLHTSLDPRETMWISDMYQEAKDPIIKPDSKEVYFERLERWLAGDEQVVLGRHGGIPVSPSVGSHRPPDHLRGSGFGPGPKVWDKE
jgi:hypothetical protein